MKRKIKISYILLFVICLTFSFGLIISNKVNASTSLSKYMEALTEREERDLIGGVKLYKQSVSSYWDGITEKSMPGYKGICESTVQWVDLPGDNEEVKVVTWSQGTIHSFNSSTVRYTAKHYEETHPGWIVVAAVNGDFFEIRSTCEAVGLMVQDGDVIRAHQHGPSATPEQSVGVLGWDDESNLYVGYPQISQEFYLEIRDENGNYTTKYPITSINGEVASEGITLITKDKKTKTDFTGATVYVGEYEFNRISNAGKVFVKGTITSKETGIEKCTVDLGKFYLACKDDSLDGILSDNTYVRCQYEMEGEWANVTSTVRYYHQLLVDGKHVYYQDYNNYRDDYGLSDKSRCVIGVKEDGSTVMMIADGRGQGITEYADSMSYFQIAEMMRIAGCVNVYQMDGGGSATLLVRNETGGFEVINRPSDGSERSIGNAILFVMRDPGLSVDTKNNTRTSITIVKNETSVSSLLEDIKITIDGKSYNMSEELLVIEGLKESTEYIVTFSYVLPDYNDPNKKIKGSFNRTVKTKDFIYPQSGLEVSKINKNSIEIKKNETQYSSWIQNVVVYVGDEKYYMGNENSLVVDNLFDDTNYKVYFTYDIIEPNNPTVYKAEDAVINVKTLAFSLPVFEKFEIDSKTNNSVKIAYQYKDEDSIVIEAYIVAYNEANKEVTRLKLSKKKGTIELSGLDLTSQSYSFKIETLYKETEESSFATSYFSEEIVQSKLESNKNNSKGCKKKTASLMVATLAVASLAALTFRKKK